MVIFSRGATKRRPRKISRSEAVVEGVERFSKRTISVCLSQHEQDPDLPSLAETEALLSEGIAEDEEEELSIDGGDKAREGDNTIS